MQCPDTYHREPRYYGCHGYHGYHGYLVTMSSCVTQRPRLLIRVSHVCYTCEWFVFNVHPVSLLADSGAELGETESAMCISENKRFSKGLQESCDNHAS